MFSWLWRRIRFSVVGQLVWESAAIARRWFDASIVGRLFYKLPHIARMLVIVIPILVIATAPIAIYYAMQTTEAKGRTDTRRPGDHIVWMEGTTLTALDDVQLEFPPTLATDQAGVAKYLQALNQNYTVEFHKDRRGEEVDKIVIHIKAGTNLRIASDVAGAIAKEGDKPKRFQVHLMGE